MLWRKRVHISYQSWEKFDAILRHVRLYYVFIVKATIIIRPDKDAIKRYENQITCRKIYLFWLFKCYWTMLWRERVHITYQSWEKFDAILPLVRLYYVFIVKATIIIRPDKDAIKGYEIQITCREIYFFWLF